MNRVEFIASSDVASFTDWLVKNYSSLSIQLNIKSSRFIPGGIQTDIAGRDLLQHYRWRTKNSKTGNWQETRDYLHELGDALKLAIAGRDQDKVLDACRRILAWGGNRNNAKGAMPFLNVLHMEGKLAEYLDTSSHAFGLDVAVIDASRPQAAKMNSMLTKVHALASHDGLPIYDSRVAAAIAALVELWRRSCGKAGEPLPSELAFPAISSDRSVHGLFADAQSPGVLSYASAAAAATAADWCSAKVRLGWLMAAVLQKAPGLFAGEATQDRMHAFEASLFMIGYDVGCLKVNAPSAGIGEQQRMLIQQAGVARLRREHAGLPHTAISTLNGTTPNISYAGDVHIGFSGVWSETTFAFDSDFLQDLLNDFPAGEQAGLGANMTGDVKPDTLGYWIKQHYPSKPRRLASALAPILVVEGYAERITGAYPVRLRFL
jgi:hypothetical protein